MYILRFSTHFQRDFATLDASIQTRILAALEKIKSQPLYGAKKLQSLDEGIFRVRVDNYRIRFDIVGKEVWLYRVRHRKDVYKK